MAHKVSLGKKGRQVQLFSCIHEFKLSACVGFLKGVQFARSVQYSRTLHFGEIDFFGKNKMAYYSAHFHEKFILKNSIIFVHMNFS